MSKVKQAKAMKPQEESELHFQNTRQELAKVEGNVEFFKELDKLIKKFHKSVEKHSKKHSIELNTTVLLQVVDETSQPKAE